MKSLGLIIFFLLMNNQASAKETLRVVTEDLPPYQIVVDGKLIDGRSYQIVKELLRRSEYKPRIEVLPWARAYSIASTQDNVLIFSMVRSKTRETHFHWLQLVDSMAYHFYALSARSELKINTIDETLNYTVATVRNSFEANSLLNMGFVEGKNLFLTLSYKAAWQMVLLERADFTYASHLIDEPLFNPQIGKPDLFVKSFSPGQKLDLYIAASLGTKEPILEKLKVTLLSMQQDGSMENLLLLQ